MSKFKAIHLADATGEAQQLLTGIKEKVGKVPNVYAVLANSPSTLAGLLTLGKELDRGSLDAVTKEKIALAVGNQNTCQNSVSAHTAIGKSLGMTEEDTIDAQKGLSEDAREKALLDLAISLNSNHGHGDNGAVRRAMEAGLNAEEVIEVLGQVVKNIMTNSLNGIAETEIDFPKVDLA